MAGAHGRVKRHSGGAGVAESHPPTADPLWVWAHDLPKIDLHRHLEGSLRLSTMVELAEAHGIALPGADVESLRPYVQVTDDPPGFQGFLDKFQILRRFYTSREAVQRIVREAIADAVDDNVVYLELRFNPLALARVQQFKLGDVVAWVVAAAEAGQQETGMRTCLILQVPREEPLSVAHEIVDLAIAHWGSYVRGIDLAGNEVDYPPEDFAEPFARARRAGLHVTAHAGEARSADSIRAALVSLRPQRIGHGIRAIEDPRVVEMLRERGTTLEVCPTSNVHTGAVPAFRQHPLVDLLRLQLGVTLNTDDPSVSATTLSDEILVAVKEMGLAVSLVYRMLRQSVEAAFIPEAERAGLRTRLRDALAARPGASEAFEA